MAHPRLSAEFFVSSDGTVLQKCPQLKRSERFKFYLASDKKCRKCGEMVRFGGNTSSPYEPIRGSHIDHVFPRSRGGSNEWTNLQLLCVSCNTSKGASL